MADNLTDVEENRLLDLSLASTGMYVALYTVAPGETGGGTEVSTSGTAYVRKEMVFPAAANGSKANSAEILFDAATADWGQIVAFAIMTAATGGTMRWYRPLDTNERRTVLNGDQYRIGPGAVTFSLA